MASKTMFEVATENAVAPFGHYAQALAFRDLVFVSAQLGCGKDRSTPPTAPIDQQTRNALSSIGEILSAAGSDLDHILSLKIFITDIGEWSSANKAIASLMPEHRPSRSVIGVASLHMDYKIAIEAIAARKAAA